MFTYSQVGRSCSVSIVPSTGPNAGQSVGTGYGETVSTAEYFACVDAVRGGFKDLGCGHAQYLSEADEMAVRKLAKGLINNG